MSEDRRFGRRLAVGLGALVLGAALLRKRGATSAAIGCGKQRSDTTGPIEWLTDRDTVQRKAWRERKFIIVAATAEWDTASKMLDHETFTDPDVRAAIHSRYVALRVDCTDDEALGFQKLKDDFKIIGTPTLILYNADFNRELIRFNEYTTAQTLLSALLYAPEIEKERAREG